MLKLKVNGVERTFDGDPQMPLLWYLRDILGLTGTKYGCGMALCGYCQPGQIMQAAALLASNHHPSDSQIDEAMAGNLCRCGTYQRIRAAIKEAAGERA
jgi:isoquinoline 1-oxidoreductase alpha subunit